MSTADITKRIPEASPRAGSKVIVAYYLLTIFTGAFVLFFHGRLAFTLDLVVGAVDLATTAFLYGISASNKAKGR